MKKFALCIILIILIVLIFIYFNITKQKGSFYIFKTKDKNIFYSKSKKINLPFRGDIKGGVYFVPESKKSGHRLSINGKTYTINKTKLLYFKKKKRITIQLLKGQIYVFNTTNFKLKEEKLLKKDSKIQIAKAPSLIDIFIKKSNKELYDYHRFVGKSFKANSDCKIIVQNKQTEKEWIKKWKSINDYNYISYYNNTYQTITAIPNSVIKKKIKINKNRILNFYAGSITSFFIPNNKFFGDGTTFTIKIRNNKREKIIFNKTIKNRINKYKVKIPFNTKEIIFKTNKNKNVFGDIAFWGSPYIYKQESKNRIILLISLDTVRARSMSIYDSSKKTTPFLKKWTKDETIIYKNAYTIYPWTTAAHRSLFFSTYSWEARKKSLAEYLQKHGFYSAAFTGGNLVSANLGFCRGFTYYSDDNFDVFNRKASSLLYRKARSFILENKGKNIFLFLHTYQAHSPYMPPVKYQTLGAKGNLDISAMRGGVSGTFNPLPDDIRKQAELLYEEEILTLDQDLIKPLINFLKGKNLYKKTGIVIFGDHGEQFYEHGSWEHGYSLYNEEVKVPLLVKDFTGKKEEIDELTCLKNIPFIITKILNIKPSALWEKRNKNYLILSTSPEYTLLSFPFKMGIINNNYKFIYNIKINKDMFKQIPDRKIYELYNLKKNPEENKNIFLEKSDIVRKLKKILNIYYKRQLHKARKTKDINRIKDNLKTLGYTD